MKRHGLQAAVCFRCSCPSTTRHLPLLARSCKWAAQVLCPLPVEPLTHAPLQVPALHCDVVGAWVRVDWRVIAHSCCRAISMAAVLFDGGGAGVTATQQATNAAAAGVAAANVAAANAAMRMMLPVSGCVGSSMMGPTSR